jgi:hypothetical protein
MRTKVILGLMVLALCAPVSAFGAVPRSTMVGGCLAAPSLSDATKTMLSTRAGLTLNTYDYAQGVTHNGPEATRVSIASGTLGDFDLKLQRGNIPWVLNSWDTVTQDRPYAAVNAGFFDLAAEAYAWGPIIRDSKIEYFPLARVNGNYVNSWSGVVGITTHPATTGGYGAPGTVTSPWASLNTSGVNLVVVPDQSAIIYDDSFVGLTTKGSATLVITDNVVTAMYPNGSAVAVPDNGYVVQAKGQRAVELRKFEVHPSVSIVRPDAETSGYLSTSATATVGSASIKLNAVNVAGVAGSTYFSSKWTSTTAAKAMTIVLSKGKVTAVYLPGRAVKPSSTSQVIQLTAPSATQKKIKVGAVVKLSLATPTVASGYQFTGEFSAAGVTFPLSAINLNSPSTASAIIFDSSWKKATPAGATTIVVKNNVVSRVISNGLGLKPAAGETVVQVPSALASLAQTLAPDTVVTVDKGVSTRIERNVAAASVMMNGSLTSGNVTLPIAAMNFRLIAPGTATAYDNNWLGPNGDKQTIRGDGTVVVRNGTIVYISNRGAWYTMTDPNDIVLQTSPELATQVAQLHVGDAADVQLTYTTRDNPDLKFITATGRGATNLHRGLNVSPCSDATDAVRPRTAIGWNSTGKFWLITTSPLRDTEAGRGGYRTGGSTVHQIGDWLKQLGASNAVSFDGGGSTFMLRYANGSTQRVDMPNEPNYQPWVRDVAVILELTDYVQP